MWLLYQVLVKLTCSLSSRQTVLLIRDILMSFKVIFQLMSMHGLDVTCLPDVLIFVLSLKINYFVHFWTTYLRRILCCIIENHLWNTLSFVFRKACSELMMWYGSSSLSQLCGRIFNRSPGTHFWVHLQNLWELFYLVNVSVLDSEKYLGKCIF